jgi:hypothetical protein
LSSFYLLPGSALMQHTENKRPLMAQPIKVGSILMKMKDWVGVPHLPAIETEPYFGEWSLVTVADAFAMDRQIHAAGWNFFFMATEVKAMFLGSLGQDKIQGAVKRILAKVNPQRFNGLEVTEIVPRRFLGVPYVTVSAHSRHIQQSCSLDSPEERRTSQNDAAWARG